MNNYATLIIVSSVSNKSQLQNIVKNIYNFVFNSNNVECLDLNV